ncbi:hypothetical protein OSTOST_21921, partial [Ostertagia ostertagi]
MPEQRHKSHSLHSSTEKKRKTFRETQNEKVKAAFRKAAQLWRDDTCIDIKEYKDFSDPGFTVNFLDVEDGDGCVSQVGKPNEGPQPLRLGKGCGSVWVQS